jgi:potassium-transporting ATPase KdpC subunit
MRISNLVRQHWAALRALLVLTIILGLGYPVFIWLVAQLPGLRDNANGSVIEVGGKPVGSSLIGQSFTDKEGKALPQYFQSRPSAAGDGYDPLATSAGNLGPESVVDTPGDPALPKDDNGFKASLLTLVCSRSDAVGKLDGVNGARPFCTFDGVGAVLSVIGPRDSRGNVVHPTRVVSVNEPCGTTLTPFLNTYEGVRVDPQVPADAVTASGSGLDPDISIAYADLQVKRVAVARGVSADQIQQAVADNTDGRWLGFFGEPSVNVLKLNLELDQKYPAKS